MTDPTTNAAGPSEVARFIAELVPALPDDTVADLRRLVSRHLSMHNSSAVRYERLGLLIDLVAGGHGEVPTTREYEELRAARAQLGETWPTHSSLGAAYGSWTRAVRAAMWLHRDGLGGHVPAANHHQTFAVPYRHDEVLDAVKACREALGVWPTEWDYDEWRKLARELARNSGKPDPRLPERNALRRLFGSFDDALQAAKRDA